MGNNFTLIGMEGINNLTLFCNDTTNNQNATDISFTIDKDQRVALIARNGAGKTSLLKILGGKDTADPGNHGKKREGP